MAVIPTCPHGHPLTGRNVTEERAPNNRVVIRCRTCRNQQRTAQRKRAKATKQARNYAIATGTPPPPPQAPAPAPDDDGGYTIGDDDPEVAWLYPHLHIGPTEVERCRWLWKTGEAKRILARARMSGHAFARETGIQPSTVNVWLRGENTPSARFQKPASTLLLALQEDNDQEDQLLAAHGYEPSLAGIKKWERDRDTDLFCGGRNNGCPVCNALPDEIALDGYFGPDPICPGCGYLADHEPHSQECELCVKATALTANPT